MIIKGITFTPSFTQYYIFIISFLSDSDWHLLLIDEVRRVGSLPPTGGVVYCIEKVSLVPLSINKSLVELNIEVNTNIVIIM